MPCPWVLVRPYSSSNHSSVFKNEHNVEDRKQNTDDGSWPDMIGSVLLDPNAFPWLKEMLSLE